LTGRWLEKFRFTGGYSPARSLVQKLRGRTVQATCILEFAHGEAAQVKNKGFGYRYIDP